MEGKVVTEGFVPAETRLVVVDDHVSWHGVYDPVDDVIRIPREMLDYPLWLENTLGHELRHQRNKGNVLKDIWLELRDFVNDCRLPVPVLLQRRALEERRWQYRMAFLRKVRGHIFGMALYNLVCLFLYLCKGFQVPFILWRIWRYRKREKTQD